jgi:hypothetical protein
LNRTKERKRRVVLLQEQGSEQVHDGRGNDQLIQTGCVV